jgi:hypothetical protein
VSFLALPTSQNPHHDQQHEYQGKEELWRRQRADRHVSRWIYHVGLSPENGAASVLAHGANKKQC